MVGDDDGVGRADEEAVDLPSPARGVVAREVAHHDVRQLPAHALHALSLIHISEPTRPY